MRAPGHNDSPRYSGRDCLHPCIRACAATRGKPPIPALRQSTAPAVDKRARLWTTCAHVARQRSRIRNMGVNPVARRNMRGQKIPASGAGLRPVNPVDNRRKLCTAIVDKNLTGLRACTRGAQSAIPKCGCSMLTRSQIQPPISGRVEAGGYGRPACQHVNTLYCGYDTKKRNEMKFLILGAGVHNSKTPSNEVSGRGDNRASALQAPAVYWHCAPGAR